jgi:RNA recognition motif-containing protein
VVPVHINCSGLHDSNPPSRNVRTEPPFGSNEDIQHPREEKKFTGRCRLFVGNLSAEVTEDEFKEWFKPFGEFTEVFLNSQKSFGFIRMVRLLYMPRT